MSGRSLPSILTIVRGACAPAMFVLALWSRPAALLMLATLAATTVLDGWLAQRAGTATPVGEWQDMFADFLVVGAVIDALGRAGVFPRWSLAILAVMFVQSILVQTASHARHDRIVRHYRTALYATAAAGLAIPSATLGIALSLALAMLAGESFLQPGVGARRSLR